MPSRIAAASMLKGLTAYMLLTQTYRVEPGTVILVHAAAGGLGAILVPLGKAPRSHRHRNRRHA